MLSNRFAASCIACFLQIMLAPQKGARPVVGTRMRLAGQAHYKAGAWYQLGIVCSSGALRDIDELQMHR